MTPAKKKMELITNAPASPVPMKKSPLKRKGTRKGKRKRKRKREIEIEIRRKVKIEIKGKIAIKDKRQIEIKDKITRKDSIEIEIEIKRIIKNSIKARKYTKNLNSLIQRAHICKYLINNRKAAYSITNSNTNKKSN
mgnify:CR=1 FL=1